MGSSGGRVPFYWRVGGGGGVVGYLVMDVEAGCTLFVVAICSLLVVGCRCW